MNAEKRIRDLVVQIADPEIPVLNLGDLGIIREIRYKNQAYEIDVTPTYSGCPAIQLIEDMIVEELETANIRNFRINRIISPPWTSDWISDRGHEKLYAYGIAPPNPQNKGRPKSCPQCHAVKLERISEFGSTPCQAIWKCLSCFEVFNYFKCI